MSRIGETSNRPQVDVFQGQIDANRAHQEILRGLDGKQVCPFCGSVGEKSGSPCARCGMDNTPDARKATKARIGPWYVLQARNPAAPGMRFETLLSFVRKGRVRARSVVRGPTTHQLWRFAAHVKGLSREFGMCFSCGSAIETTANICPQCNRLQEPPLNPDILLEDGTEADAARPVYRELPKPAELSAPIVEAHAPTPASEDADIVIPAFGAFDQVDVEPRPSEAVATAPEPAAPAPRASSPFSTSSSARPGPQPLNPSPSPRPAGENPFAIAPPRKKGNGDSTFLSAKDLAAAFKLSFDPSADMETVDVPDQMPANAMPEGMRPAALTPSRPQMQLAPEPRPAFGPVPKQRGAFKKFVLFVLIMAVTGFVVLMWVDPQSRERTADWLKTNYGKLSRYANGTDVPPKTTSAENPPTAKEEIDPSMRLPVESAPPAADKPAPDESVIATEEKAPDPVDAPEAAPIAEAPPAPSPTPAKANPQPAPTPVDKAATPAPANESADTASQGEKVNAENLMTIYRRGVKAQGAGDYATAIRDYQAIQKLPKEDWPPDLTLRLTRSQSQLNAQKKKPAK